jgi:hypothetical protein
MNFCRGFDYVLGSSTRDENLARHDDFDGPEDIGKNGATARIWDHANHRANLRHYIVAQLRNDTSRAVEAGERGVNHIRVGSLGGQSEGQVLSAHDHWPQTT